MHRPGPALVLAQTQRDPVFPGTTHTSPHGPVTAVVLLVGVIGTNAVQVVAAARPITWVHVVLPVVRMLVWVLAGLREQVSRARERADLLAR